MRIGTEAGAAYLLPVALQLVFIEPAFEVGARIDAGGRMRLEEHQVAAVFAVCRMEEMIEADLKDFGGGRIASDTAAELAMGHIGARDHRQRVPTDNGGDPRLHIDVAGKRALPFEGDVFEKAMTRFPEVMECYLMTGDSDYLLRVVVPDTVALQHFLVDRLSKTRGVANIRSSLRSSR